MKKPFIFLLSILVSVHLNGQLLWEGYLVNPNDSERVSAVFGEYPNYYQAGMTNRNFSASYSTSFGNEVPGDLSFSKFNLETLQTDYISWPGNAASIHDAFETQGGAYILIGSYGKDLDMGSFLLTIDQAQERPFSARLDTNGNIEWLEGFHPGQMGRSASMAGFQYNGLFYEVGSNFTDSYLLKRDIQTGSILDSLIFNATTCSDIIVTDHHEIIITGTTSDTSLFGLSRPRAGGSFYQNYVAVLDSNFNGVELILSHHITFDISNRLHLLSSSFIHEGYDFSLGQSSIQQVYLKEYTFAGQPLALDSMPFFYSYELGRARITSSGWYCTVQLSATQETILYSRNSMFNPLNIWAAAGVFSGPRFSSVHYVEKPAGLMIAGTLFTDTLNLGSTQYPNPHAGAVPPYHRFWVSVTDSNLLSASDAVSNALSVYPNPVSSVLYIKGSASTWVNFEILSMQGMLMKSGALHGNGGVDISEFPEGIYLMRISEQGKKITSRLIIKSP